MNTTPLRASALLILAAVIGCIVQAHTGSAFIAFASATAAVIPFTPIARPTLGAHIELVSFSAVQPNTGAAATALAGDSLIVKYSKDPAKIIGWWPDHQVAGYQQISFPSGHDTTRGLRMNVRAGEVDNLLPEGIGIDVQPQETLSVTIAGSNVSGDVESGSFLLMYPQLSGSAQRGIGWNELVRRASKYTTVYLTLTGAAAGYTGAEAINAETDLLMANRDYALLGGTVSAESCTIAIAGPDTGNVRIGFPANDLEPENSLNFFPRLARAFNQPIIPVINSGNKANTLVSLVQDENNISPTVALFLALLD